MDWLTVTIRIKARGLFDRCENCVETARRGQEPRIRSLGPPAANESSSPPPPPGRSWPLWPPCSSNVSFILFFFTRSHMAGHNRPFVYIFEHVARPVFLSRRTREEIGEASSSRNNPSDFSILKIEMLVNLRKVI